MSLLLCPLLLLPFAARGPSQDKKSDAKKPAAPKVLFAAPLVARPGEKQKLALRGRNLAGVKEVTVAGADDAKLKVLGAKAVNVPNNASADRVGDSEVEIELELPKGAKTGEVKLVAVGPGGNSNAYPLLLRDDLPAVAEKEENGAYASAQPVSLPGAVEGTIKGERDVDVYKFEGKKGRKVRIEVQAARFGSPLDAFLTVADAGRNILDTADDAAGSTDPVLTVVLPRDGTYYVSVIDAHDAGGPGYGYRLVLKPE